MAYFDFRIVWLYKSVFLNGLLLTLLLAIAAIILGSAIGLLLALGKRSSNRWVRIAASAYIDFFRIVPILILLVWVYYAMPILLGISIDAFWTGVLVLSAVLSAYVAETVRAGIEAIPSGQVDAALTLGYSKFQALTRIVLPQALRQMLAPLVGNYIELIKNTSLTTVIAVNELLHSGQILISQTYRPLEIYTAIAVLYLVVMLPVVMISKKFELGNFNSRSSK